MLVYIDMRIYQSASLVDLTEKLDPVPATLATTTRGMLFGWGDGKNESLGFTPQSFRHSVWMIIVDATHYSGHLGNKIGGRVRIITINNEAVKLLSHSFFALNLSFIILEEGERFPRSSSFGSCCCCCCCQVLVVVGATLEVELECKEDSLDESGEEVIYLSYFSHHCVMLRRISVVLGRE